MKMKRLLKVDWDAIAGILAAVAALVLHFLHIVEEEVLLMISLVLLALLFVRDLRRETQAEESMEALRRNEALLHELRAGLELPDAILVGPRDLRRQSQRFAEEARGEMVWFHVCLLMFKNDALFDLLLRPAIENDRVTSIQFVLDEEQKPLWEDEVRPRVEDCSGAERVKPPIWTSIEENVSFILSETGGEKKASRALLSFWGEPFMAETASRSVPRFIFHVQEHSELITRLAELERSYRLSA